jgi:molybdopterin-guanine dinucleotide biosynthesis protein A
MRWCQTADVSGARTAELGGIVLTGGGAVRFQGADKASIEVAGVTLLEHVLGALAEVPEVVVVGDEVLTSRPVSFVREDPPGGGPAAGLLAGLAGFPRTPRLVVVLAVDMPLVTTATVSRLMLSAEEDGALLVDEDGKRQYLCAIYRGAALTEAAPPLESQHGLSMRSLVSGLRLAEVEAMPWEARDVDTWDDLTALREHLGEHLDR